MKFFHLSDLHLGKRVNEFSMIDDQRYILDRIVGLCKTEQPQAVVIAGDVYDKPIPPAEAVELFDHFLVRLSALGIRVLVISGNHDSSERLAFGGRLMTQSGVYFAPVYNGSPLPVTLQDEYGPVDFWLLPFLKPAHVRRFFPEAEIESYTDALATAIGAMPLDPGRRNVLVTHQFVTGASRCDSEEISVGGSDNVDAAVLEGFDYVALGHIHGPQQVGKETVRYCGTPLKYSFSEAGHKKSVTVVELGPKGEVTLGALPLVPLHDMKELRGSYEELTLKSFYSGQPWQQDYLRIILTDEEDIPEAIGRLRVIYPNIMRLDYDNRRTRSQNAADSAQQVEQLSPLQLFAQLYEKQNNQPRSPEQTEFAAGLIEAIWEGEK